MSATTPVENMVDATNEGGGIAPGGNRRGHNQRRQRRHGVSGWWAVPGIAVVLALIYIPTSLGSFYAFTDWAGIGGWNWVGLKNFNAILHDSQLLGSLKNTVLIAFGFVVLTSALGLLLALALNRTLKTRYLLRTLVFMPVVLAPIAVSYMWGFIFAYNGPLNQILADVGLKSWQQNWLADPTLAKVCVLTVMVWQNTGFVMVIYLAGLATVPIELEEAAALDGAGRLKRLWHIVLPSIKPSIAIATTLMLVQGLRIFDQIMALTGGGPAGATQTLATEIYQQTIVFGKYGFGAALAVLLSILILALSAIQLFATRERDRTRKVA